MNSRWIRIVAFALLAVPSLAAAQEKESIRLDDKTSRIVSSPWKTIDVETTASFRGLHVVDDRIIWASGSQGTVIVSNDGGETWRVRIVAGAEALDFRDIHAFDDGTAVIISSGDVARIYRTTNGGRTWKPCGQKPRAFFDAISFWNETDGIVMSDPVGGKFWLAKTVDGGKSWSSLENSIGLRPYTGEAGFAASGTNMCVFGDANCVIGLGGAPEGRAFKSCRVLISTDRGNSWQFGGNVPMRRSPSSGIFSLWFNADGRGVAVGGDYLKPDATASNYAFTKDGGKTWTVPKKPSPPSGYRSCVSSWIKGREIRLVSVGTNGTDLSTDLGASWRRISNRGFNAVDFSDSGKSGWAVGQNGSVSKWILNR